jgi:hypothetical protein
MLFVRYLWMVRPRLILAEDVFLIDSQGFSNPSCTLLLNVLWANVYNFNHITCPARKEMYVITTCTETSDYITDFISRNVLNRAHIARTADCISRFCKHVSGSLNRP